MYRKNALAFADGSLRSKKEKNREVINNHNINPTHNTIIQTLQQKKKDAIEIEFKNIQHSEAEREHDLQITARIMRTVYVEVKRNIPFDSHSDMVALQEMNGINMGYHDRDTMSAVKVMESISSVMHKILISNLLLKNSPISIIIDGSTDYSGANFLIVYFQAIESNVPVIYFYKLLPVSENANAILMH